MILGLGGLVPLPPDALITPVTFRVRKRELRGILAEFDDLEDGTRELSGEWVVTKRLWQRLQAEWRASQSKSRADPETPPRKHTERIILYLHGGQSSCSRSCVLQCNLNLISNSNMLGAYYLFSPATHRSVTIPLSKFTDARIFGTLSTPTRSF
jgi:hypothetical protein